MNKRPKLTSRSWIAICLIALCYHPSFGRAQINLVINNWQLSGSGSEYGPGYGEGGSDFLGPNPGNLSEWYQDLPTTPGQPYQFSFYLRGSYPAGQSPPFAMDVFWNTQSVTFSWDVYSSAWIYASLIVTGGPGTQSVIGFSDPYPTFSEFSAVSVVTIPETSTLTMAGLGIGCMLVFGCRKFVRRV